VPGLSSEGREIEALVRLLDGEPSDEYSIFRKLKRYGAPALSRLAIALFDTPMTRYYAARPMAEIGIDARAGVVVQIDRSFRTEAAAKCQRALKIEERRADDPRSQFFQEALRRAIRNLSE